LSFLLDAFATKIENERIKTRIKTEVIYTKAELKMPSLGIIRF